MSDAKITRAATAAVRVQSRPRPDAREMNAQRYARATRAGTHWGTGCQTWTKVPLLTPMAPSQIRVAANNACPALAMRIAWPSALLEVMGWLGGSCVQCTARSRPLPIVELTGEQPADQFGDAGAAGAGGHERRGLFQGRQRVGDCHRQTADAEEREIVLGIADADRLTRRDPQLVERREESA